ncbi:hypothetical protein [Roseococcus pinisoli]|uniref:DUF2232 domain-containing protein n=1 Tax=Roseococcus pinisoli TaxID=2835040 RepID=A0ABS5QA95_9PROT|nr:hypothetical protein [Roseococcus pinisoli]MBS7810627.1 hypothetical protein [Roseococcus pinisoli]
MSQTSGQGGLFSHPEALAAGAAGLGSAVLALWAMHGMPLGTLLLWLSPLPIFAAGFGFGARAAVGATALAGAVVLFSASTVAMGVYLAIFGVPAALVVAGAKLQSGRMDLTLPLAVLGIWPVLVLLILAIAIPDLEGEMRTAVELGVARMGVTLPDGMVDQIAQVKAAAAGFWLALLMVGNGLAAQNMLSRQGLALHATPGGDEVHLPGWYLPLPAVALAAWLAFGGAVALSSLVILLVPVFLLGVVGVHRRLRGRSGRVAILAAFYVLMLLFLQIMAPLMVGVGLLDQYRRPSMPPPT